MNSLRIEVGGMAAISSGVITVMKSRNFSMREASVYAGDDGEILLSIGSAKYFSTGSSKMWAELKMASAYS